MARVCVDSNYFTILPSGELSMVPGSMGLRQLVVFSATGNSQFIKANYPGLARVRVRVIGAGGGGRYRRGLEPDRRHGVRWPRPC